MSAPLTYGTKLSSVSYTNDGDLLVAAEYGVFKYDSVKRKLNLASYYLDKTNMEAVRVSDDGFFVLTFDNDHTAKVWFLTSLASPIRLECKIDGDTSEYESFAAYRKTFFLVRIKGVLFVYDIATETHELVQVDCNTKYLCCLTAETVYTVNQTGEQKDYQYKLMKYFINKGKAHKMWVCDLSADGGIPILAPEISGPRLIYVGATFTKTITIISPLGL